jgi:hypothetical protein
MGKRRGIYSGFGGEIGGKETTWETGLGGKIILRWIFRRGLWGNGLNGSGSG